ncbi:ketopantoate reductase family protein [Shewanella aestuarii]|uniref:2-dehydropantoate 2-reductase n=1 Tax=Shewanella aestuarii TaxID=1028752 RepID=A0A6G9QGX1_9GAMM|nr:2-dehydropantoate 2-reductase [Shewanella aestuarii]QIR13726.1 2-dehydropantoate 2-reductase [Shewanella aestuarii]
MGRKHIGVLGAGAIGQLIFSQLSAHILTHHLSHSFRVDLVSRQAQPQSISFTDLMGNPHSQTLSLLDIKSEQLANIDVVIVCVKAYQVHPLVLSILNKVKPDCHIILLHNGMGPHLAVAKLLQDFPQMGLTLATTSQGALRISPWHVKHTGEGKTSFGHFCGAPLDEAIQKCITNAIPNSCWLSDIQTALWLKLIINCAINPLTAYYQCPNGQLIDDAYQDEIKAVISECVLVASADGINLDEKECCRSVLTVCQLTANNISSMWQDIQSNRQTEIEFISGFIVNRAKHHGIVTPANQLNLDRISALYQMGNA